MVPAAMQGAKQNLELMVRWRGLSKAEKTRHISKCTYYSIQAAQQPPACAPGRTDAHLLDSPFFQACQLPSTRRGKVTKFLNSTRESLKRPLGTDCTGILGMSNNLGRSCLYPGSVVVVFVGSCCHKIDLDGKGRKEGAEQTKLHLE